MKKSSTWLTSIFLTLLFLILGGLLVFKGLMTGQLIHELEDVRRLEVGALYLYDRLEQFGRLKNMLSDMGEEAFRKTLDEKKNQFLEKVTELADGLPPEQAAPFLEIRKDFERYISYVSQLRAPIPPPDVENPNPENPDSLNPNLENPAPENPDHLSSLLDQITAFERVLSEKIQNLVNQKALDLGLILNQVIDKLHLEWKIHLGVSGIFLLLFLATVVVTRRSAARETARQVAPYLEAHASFETLTKEFEEAKDRSANLERSLRGQIGTLETEKTQLAASLQKSGEAFKAKEAELEATQKIIQSKEANLTQKETLLAETEAKAKELLQEVRKLANQKEAVEATMPPRHTLDLNSFLKKLIDGLPTSKKLFAKSAMAKNLPAIETAKDDVESAIESLVHYAVERVPSGGHLLFETATVSGDANLCRQYSTLREFPYIRLRITDNGPVIHEADWEDSLAGFLVGKKHPSKKEKVLLEAEKIMRREGGAFGMSPASNEGMNFDFYFSVGK